MKENSNSYVIEEPAEYKSYMQERSFEAIFNFLASFEIGLCGG